MVDYSAYFDRLSAQGGSHQEATQNFTKRQAVNYIMSSPSRVSVYVMQLMEDVESKRFELIRGYAQHAIVSNKESFYRREVLAPPGAGFHLGLYLKYEDMYYLIVESNKDDIYLNSLMVLCNYSLEIVGDVIRIRDGTDEFGRPKWKEERIVYEIPCAIESKEYSIAENSPIPLPDGVINITIPYHENINIPVNYMATFNGETYQVTSANEEKVIAPIGGEKYGYVVLRGQRVVNE